MFKSDFFSREKSLILTFGFIDRQPESFNCDRRSKALSFTQLVVNTRVFLRGRMLVEHLQSNAYMMGVPK